MAVKQKQAAFKLEGIPKGALHNLLHRLLMAEVEAGVYQRPGATDDKRKENIRLIIDRRRIHQHHKNYYLLNRLKSKALSLLKTQFAKKPKNPT